MIKFGFIPCKNITGTLLVKTIATLNHTKEKPCQSESTLKWNKAIFHRVWLYSVQEPNFITIATLNHKKEKPYQSEFTLKWNKAIFHKVWLYSMQEHYFTTIATLNHTKEKLYQSVYFKTE